MVDPLSRTTRVSRYQKKHSSIHHPDHHPIFISFFHLLRSIASSLFKLCAWQSFLHNLSPCPLWSTSCSRITVNIFTAVSSNYSQHFTLYTYGIQHDDIQMQPLTRRVIPYCMLDGSNKKRTYERYAPLYYYKNHHHTTTTVLQPFFRDHPGEPMPEENFWTLWCKGRLTEEETPIIRLGDTPSGLTSAHLHHPPHIFL